VPESAITPPRASGIERLDAAFRTHAKVFREAVARPRALLGDHWAALLDDTISRLFPSEDALVASVEGYSRFALESLRLQARFEKERVYANTSYAEASKNVYANDDYMRSCYLPGLLLSHYLWPHHFRQSRHFEQSFVDRIRRRDVREFADVGIGTGFYSRSLLTAIPTIHGVGYDVSPSSKAFTESHVAAFGAADRYRVELGEVGAIPVRLTDCLVSVEVLEHLEDPPAFLRALRAMLAPGGTAYITAALNAANADHIYLYRTADEVKSHIEQAGFVVEEYFSALAGKPSSPGTPVAEVTAFIVT
jgi:SAM-dependent methyltransferase